MIARWFWWRVNATTELASLAATVILGTCVLIFLPNYEVDGETIDLFGLRVLIMTFGVAAVWIPIAFISSTVPSKAAVAFHKKMQIGGAGWNAITKVPAELKTGLSEWVVVMAFLLCILIGTGKLLFHELAFGLILLACAAILLIPFIGMLKRAKSS